VTITDEDLAMRPLRQLVLSRISDLDRTIEQAGYCDNYTDAARARDGRAKLMAAVAELDATLAERASLRVEASELRACLADAVSKIEVMRALLSEAHLDTNACLTIGLLERIEDVLAVKP
jgi:hypothetical protein